MGLHPLAPALAPGCGSISPCRAPRGDLLAGECSVTIAVPLGTQASVFLPGHEEHRVIDASRVLMADFIDSASATRFFCCILGCPTPLDPSLTQGLFVLPWPRCAMPNPLRVRHPPCPRALLCCLTHGPPDGADPHFNFQKDQIS